MSTEFTIRPRLRFFSPKAPDALASDLMEYFRAHRSTYFGYVVKHHAVVEMHEDKVQLWSPRMEVDLEEYNEGTLVRGLMAPRPGVWAFLMFLYGLFGFSCFFSMIIGLSDWTLGAFPWQLILSGGCLLGILAVYLFAQGGKRIVHGEMVEMKAWFVEALGEVSEMEGDEVDFDEVVGGNPIDSPRID
ncbi:MAG: hypothetical protein R3B47_16180 [Bacteroidia bacterium]